MAPPQGLLYRHPCTLGELRERLRASFALRKATGAGGGTRERPSEHDLFLRIPLYPVYQIEATKNTEWGQFNNGEAKVKKSGGVANRGEVRTYKGQVGLSCGAELR